MNPSTSDPREATLAALVVELAKIEANQAEARKLMKETVEDLREQIQRLAADIDSGQGVLPLEVP